MKLLAIGDIVGSAGMAFLGKSLPALREQYRPDFVVINGENANLFGLRPQQAEELRALGADAVTLGNHVWGCREITPMLDDAAWLLRPENIAPSAPGEGARVFTAGNGATVCVVSLLGRCEMDFRTRDPFEVLEGVLKRCPADYTVVDFHAEATSEKMCLAWNFDGRVSVVFGTHTHVQTADEQILPRGTGFITDLGMTGPRLSSLGVNADQGVLFFKGLLTKRYEQAGGPCRLGGAVFTLDKGLCIDVERIQILE